MSAGEVERLVSELSGGTGGDEEEEWLYGGTELPVPSLLPGSLKPPLPACKRLASRALHAAAWGLSYGSYSGLSLAERVVLASPPLGLAPCPHPQLAPILRRRGPTSVAGTGLGPQPLPPPRRGFSAAWPSRTLLLFLYRF